VSAAANTRQITKALHTVTAVSRLAMYLRDGHSDAHQLVCKAMVILGYDPEQHAVNNPIVLACIVATEKAMGVRP